MLEDIERFKEYENRLEFKHYKYLVMEETKKNTRYVKKVLVFILLINLIQMILMLLLLDK